MRRFLLCLLFLISLWPASSQKVYFVYLQTEMAQPFFVKMDERVYSSTATGYLVLSKLRDSSYSFSIGFPQNKWPENNFSVAVNKKDHGYLLKNFGEKGWGLFDLQALSVQMHSVAMARADVAGKTENNEVSAFTDILSRAADDPSLKEKPVVPIAEEKKPEVIAQELPKKEELKAVVTDPEVFIRQEEPKTGIKEQPVEKKEEVKILTVASYKPTVVIKKSESSTTEGFGLVFIDQYENGTNDTIRLFIPNSKPVLNEIKQEPKEEKKFLDILADSEAVVKKQAPEINKEIAEPKETKPVTREIPVDNPVAKINCADVAGESDFFRLRKKMAAETADDDMVMAARRYFKTKCFTTVQLKNLSALFLNDAGKYKFFDAAYSYVADAENFNSLQAEMKEEYYINRFKAMLHNQP